MRRSAACTLLLLTLAGCGSSSPARKHQAPAAPPLLSFAYARGAPLRFADHGVVGHGGTVAIHDVSYRSGGSTVSAFLVEGPARPGRPGVVVVHGFGGDRSELLDEAVALARAGAVALAITAPSSAHPPPRAKTIGELLAESRTTQARDVVAVRRAGDVLQSLPDVLRGRLGYLGWSAGGKTGTFVAATDRRFAALALLSAGADTLDSFVAAAPPSARAEVRRQLGSVDPIRYVARARPGTLLLEDGRSDSVVPHRALLNIVRAAPRGTTVRWYAADHGLTPAAYREATTWLLRKLR